MDIVRRHERETLKCATQRKPNSLPAAGNLLFPQLLAFYCGLRIEIGRTTGAPRPENCMFVADEYE